MFGFFVMGFVDIVGITTSYVKNDFSHLTDTMVNLISLSCFLWFLVLSIPTGMLMNRIGRKKTVLLSFAFHVLAMCLPLVAYDFTAILIAFALIGIGNTLLQVSLNPLVTDVVANDKLTGTLTLGQFVKAVSSFLGPILAAWVTGSFFGWKMIFPVYAGLSLLALIWLWLTPIQEKQQERKNISFKVTLELFKDKYILAFFIGILVLVGVDVGINMTFPKFLMERCDLPLTDAGMGNSVYFFARTVGAFLGGILLMKYSESKFYIYSVWIALAGLILMTISTNLWFILGFRDRICQSVFHHLLSVFETCSRESERSICTSYRRCIWRCRPPAYFRSNYRFIPQSVICNHSTCHCMVLSDRNNEKNKNHINLYSNETFQENRIEIPVLITDYECVEHHSRGSDDG